MDIKDKIDMLFRDIPKIDITNTNYIKYPKDLIDILELEFIKIVDEEMGTSFSKDGWHRQGIIGRYIDDSGSKHLKNGWYFFTTMDEEYRRWEQPYYTYPANYEKHKHEAMCINDKHPELLKFFRGYKLDKILD